jgi:hypothetical protein
MMSNARRQFLGRVTARPTRGAFASLATALLAAGLAFGPISSATAQPTPPVAHPSPPAAPPPTTAPPPPAKKKTTTVAAQIPCPIAGRPAMLFGVKIYSDAQAGKAIARFTGARSALRVLELPRTAAGRALVETGTGQGAGQFRVKGYVAVKDLPLYLKHAVPVVPSHVWIGSAHRIQFRNADPMMVTVEMRMEFPFHQVFVAQTTCATLALEPKAAPPPEIAGNARGYVLEKESLELYDRPGRDAEPIMWLQRGLVEPGPLFWSTERKGSWIRVELHGAVDVSGWAKKRALRRLPKGELVDEFPPPSNFSTGPRLKLSDTATLVKVPNAVELLGAAKKNAPKIGLIEPGTEVYIVDRVAQWVSVMPKSMHLAPPDGQQFWAPSAAFKRAK